jgi:hypothetical protein
VLTLHDEDNLKALMWLAVATPAYNEMFRTFLTHNFPIKTEIVFKKIQLKIEREIHATCSRRLKILSLQLRVSAQPQSTHSAGPVRFLIFCSISISLLASLVAGRNPRCNSGAE